MTGEKIIESRSKKIDVSKLNSGYYIVDISNVDAGYSVKSKLVIR